MIDEKNKASDEKSGSAGATERGSGDTGETKTEETVPKSQYEELFSKFGKQGEELGIYRKYAEEFEPIMKLMEDNPEIEEALLSGKLDSELAKAVLDGRVTKEQATEVAEAHQQVKKDMTKDEYKEASPDKILEEMGKIVDAKLQEALKPAIEQSEKKINDLSSQMSTQQRIAANEQKIREFIAATQDFGEYSSEIQERMEARPGLSIVEAYELVKAKHILEQASKERSDHDARSSKEVAANARGGQGSHSGKNVVQGDRREEFIKMRDIDSLGFGG